MVEALTLVLEYYPTLATLRALHARAAVYPDLAAVFDYLRDQVLAALHEHPHAPSLQRFLAPVWELLAFTPAELVPPVESSLSRRETPSQPLDVAAVLSACADPDQRVPWASASTHSAAIAPADRARLRAALVEHPDPGWRWYAAAASAWDDEDALRALCLDPVRSVRRAAIYALGELPVDPARALFLWQRFLEDQAAGWDDTQTLAAYARQAGPATIPRLLALALDPRIAPSLRVTAVEQVEAHGDPAALRQLLPLLCEPPPLTWDLHCALLDAAAEHHLPLPTGTVAALGEADHLDLQRALAKALGATCEAD